MFRAARSNRVGVVFFSTLGRWPLVFFTLSLFRESGLCFRLLQGIRAASAHLSIEIRNSAGSSLAAWAPFAPSKSPRVTRLTLELRTLLGNAIAADVDVDKPATSAVAPRTGIGLCIFQRASRCAFAVRFSIRRVEALSHEGKRRREATGEGVARGLRRERRRPIVRGWSAFFSFF